MTWRQQAAASAADWTYGYDAVDQVTSAAKRADSDGSLLGRFAYSYDRAGNRLSEQIDDAVVSSTYDSLNRLLSQQGGGPVAVKGQVNEPATVTINGSPALVEADGTFRGTAMLTTGTSTVNVVARDASGNATTAVYQVDQSAATKTFAVDANGNITSDGTRTFEWDAQDQLVAINDGTRRIEFSYDGGHHRTRIVERNDGAITNDRHFVWCGQELCEERDGSGAVVRRFAMNGEQVNDSALFYATDHLNSVRNMTDTSGAIRAAYDYDPYGRATRVAGDQDSSFGFTHHFWLADSDMELPMFRAYDPTVGRWLSEDPLGIRDGLNRYAYVGGQPLSQIDPSGLCKCPDCPGGTWIGSAGLVEFALGFGKFSFGGLVFAGVLVCTSKPSVNVPFVSACNFGGPHTESVRGGGAHVGAAPYVQCNGYKCKQDLEGTEWGTYIDVGDLFGFAETSSGQGCKGGGAGAGAGFGGGALYCRTWVGR